MIFSPNRSHFGASCAGAAFPPQIEGVSLGKEHPFIHVASESNRRGGLRNHRERLS
jgi:hypothetical protein